MERRHSKREIAKLRWGYLQQSKKYRIFCEIMQNITPTKKGLTEAQADTITHEYSEWVLSKGVPSSGDDLDWHSLYMNWEIYGDVFNQDGFDKWWDKRGKRSSTPIIDLRDRYLNRKLPFLDWPFRKGKIMEKEVRPRLSSRLRPAMQRYPEYLFVAVPISEVGDVEALSRQLNKILKSWIVTSPIYYDMDITTKRYTGVLAERLRFEQIEHYLDVLKEMNEGKTLEQVIKKYGEDPSSSYQKFKFKRIYKKAETIKNNVERGFFPGIYDHHEE